MGAPAHLVREGGGVMPKGIKAHQYVQCTCPRCGVVGPSRKYVNSIEYASGEYSAWVGRGRLYEVCYPCAQEVEYPERMQQWNREKRQRRLAREKAGQHAGS